MKKMDMKGKVNTFVLALVFAALLGYAAHKVHADWWTPGGQVGAITANPVAQAPFGAASGFPVLNMPAVTVATAVTMTPGQVGQTMYCINCTVGAYALLRSTGTALDQWSVYGSNSGAL